MANPANLNRAVVEIDKRREEGFGAFRFAALRMDDGLVDGEYGLIAKGGPARSNDGQDIVEIFGMEQ